MKKIIICCIIVIVTMLQGCDDRHTSISEEFIEENSINETKEIEITSSAMIYVYVCGQVKNPGVYAMPSGSRVCDGIEMAGGTLKKATLDNLNLASVLEDGEKLYVYSKDELVTTMPEEKQEDDGLVDINRALKEELMTLPGIGETRAEAIISYRDNNGYFESIEDIMKINGIKQSVFDNIKDLISVG